MQQKRAGIEGVNILLAWSGLDEMEVKQECEKSWTKGIKGLGTLGSWRVEWK